MKVLVKLIGGLVHPVGFAAEEIPLPKGTTTGALLAGLGIDHHFVVTTRNGQGVAMDEAVEDADRILVSPPFSGG